MADFRLLLATVREAGEHFAATAERYGRARMVDSYEAEADRDRAAHRFDRAVGELWRAIEIPLGPRRDGEYSHAASEGRAPTPEPHDA